MWPESIPEWAGFIVLGLTFVATVVGFIWRTSAIVSTMQSGFKAHGERLGLLEQKCAQHGSSISVLESRDQNHEFKMASLAEGQGELKGRIDQLLTVLERRDDAKTEQDLEVVQRLARIEERLDIFPKMLELMQKREKQ